MREVTIGPNEGGQRFDKYLKKYLKEAGSGFLYKMLRKKNITLNGRRADGSEKLNAGDRVCFFLSDETIEKFRGPVPAFRETLRSGNLHSAVPAPPRRREPKRNCFPSPFCTRTARCFLRTSRPAF